MNGCEWNIAVHEQRQSFTRRTWQRAARLKVLQSVDACDQHIIEVLRCAPVRGDRKPLIVRFCNDSAEHVYWNGLQGAPRSTAVLYDLDEIHSLGALGR
jgi:hypothetical protein